MIDISAKFSTLRYAKAKGMLRVETNTVERIKSGDLPKKNPLEVARVAGIMAAKKTPEIIPYCHPVPVQWVNVDFNLMENAIEVEVEVKAVYLTGVEMEALTAVSAALLTLYDMLKPIDKSMYMEKIELVEKKGGKSDFTEKYEKPLKAAVIVASDTISAGKKEDRAGKAIMKKLEEYGIEIKGYEIIPDEAEIIEKTITRFSDDEKVDLILTSGGTGLGPRDVTVEVTRKLIDKEVPGITEAIRKYGLDRTPYAMLSRAIAGVRGKTLIVNLPGSTRGALESVNAIFPGVLHIFKMIAGGRHD